MPKIFYVQLTVGNNEFFGEGKTRQAARHNAAMKALQALQNEPIPEKSPQVCYCHLWQSLPCKFPSEIIGKTNKCIFKNKRNNLFWSARILAWWPAVICFSVHLSTVLDSHVPARMTLPLRTSVHLWSLLLRQHRTWGCKQGWEIAFIYLSFNAYEHRLHCVHLESRSLKWNRFSWIFFSPTLFYRPRYWGWCWVIAPIPMASTAFSVDFKMVSLAQTCLISHLLIE